MPADYRELRKPDDAASALIKTPLIQSVGIAAGIATHALFLFTVWKLVPFLWEIWPRELWRANQPGDRRAVGYPVCRAA